MTEVKKKKKKAKPKKEKVILDKVPIYQSEVDVISSQEDIRLQKMLFAILVMAKFNVEYENAISNELLIRRKVNVIGTKTTLSWMIQPILCEDEEFVDDELLVLQFRGKDKNNKDNSFFHPTFIEYNKTKEPLFYVTYEQMNVDGLLAKVFSEHFREGLYCSVCDKKIENINSNRQKYCVECSKEVRRKYIAQKVREFRKKKKEGNM